MRYTLYDYKLIENNSQNLWKFQKLLLPLQHKKSRDSPKIKSI